MNYVPTHYSVHIRRANTVMLIDEASLFIPDNVLKNMTGTKCKELGLCDGCEMHCKCHVVVWHATGKYHDNGNPQELGHIYCPVLFHDAVKPTSWKVNELV